MVTGVAAGMAEYLDLAPVLSRLLWVLAAIFSFGLVVVVYFIMAVIMPVAPRVTSQPESEAAAGAEAAESDAALHTVIPAAAPPPAKRRGRASADAIVGITLLVLGGIALLDSFGLFAFFNPWRLWPLILIGVGLAIVFGRRRRV